MDPASVFGTEAAVLTNAKPLLALISYIVGEVHRFEKDCLELTNSYIDLSLALLEHERELKDIKAREDFKIVCKKSIF